MESYFGVKDYVKDYGKRFSMVKKSCLKSILKGAGEGSLRSPFFKLFLFLI